MWRDPLDELIDDLERVTPAPLADDDPHAQFMALQKLTDEILYGTPDAFAPVKADPAVQRSRERPGDRGEAEPHEPVAWPGASTLAERNGR